MIQRILLVILVVVGAVSDADEVENLYQSVVAVDDQSAESREQGIKTALEKVLIKLSGNQEMVLSALATSSTVDAAAYVDALSFQDLPTSKNDLVGNRLGLSVEFSRSAVDQLIRSLQLPVLPANRPVFLFWIVKDDTSLGRRYLGQEVDDVESFSDQMLASLDNLMVERGIPYVLPTFDLEDQLVLPVDTTWNLNRQKIEFASRRYKADGWVALRFYSDSAGDVRGTWMYQTQGSPASVDFSATADVDWFTGEIHQLIDRLASSFSYLPQAVENLILVEVSGVNSLDNYRQLFQQIEKLEVVNSVDLFSVRGRDISLAVSAEGGVELLYQAMVRSGFFQSRSDQIAVENNNLYFRWTPQ
ncbi:DUF2066 domain-containing protein [Porticoccaceae bacterium]|nr:DUF2066 domain-containing protein [Porticoccaceae bacterium]MDA8651595.1 DUF2066 domain-containing protein [Porticoccaceae bacterium]MDB2663674.1 DUF2066 domain-containing protein [Porticoccaceae bacterium]